MKFIRVGRYIVNAAYIRCVFESADEANVCITHDDEGNYLTVSKLEWNKAVRDAGVPDLQWFDR